jgi:AraC-like DNA-binding protein
VNIRTDIADLLRAGHTDTHIAHQLGCHRNTVHRTRQALGIPPTRVLDRLRVEAAPVQIRDRYREPLTAEQVAANRELLAAAVYRTRRPRRPAAA